MSFGSCGNGHDHVRGCIGSVWRDHDTEHVLWLDEDGIKAFLRLEMLPDAADA